MSTRENTQGPAYYGSAQQIHDLEATAEHLAHQLWNREKSYRGSWQKRGGIGAFMMLARKIDRLAIALDKVYANRTATVGVLKAKIDNSFLKAWQRLEDTAAANHYDIFKVWEILEQQKDGEMNDLEDFVGYCLHVINEMRTVRPRRLAAHSQPDPSGNTTSNNVVKARVVAAEVRGYCGTDAMTDTACQAAPMSIQENSPSPQTPPLRDDDPPHYTLEQAKADQNAALHHAVSHGVSLAVIPPALDDDPCHDLSGPLRAAKAINDFDEALQLVASHGIIVDPSSWQASHPHNYKSASDRQCPACWSTYVGEADKVGFLHCRTCGCDFPIRIQQPGDSAYDQPFPQAFVARDRNQPESFYPDRDVTVTGDAT